MGRAPNLRADDTDAIVEILDGWSGPLSWDLLIAAIEKRMFRRYTRQALHKHSRIHDAFAHKKKALAEQAGKVRPAVSSPELQMALDVIERLKAENARLENENRLFREKFVLWAYNAHTRNLTEAFLSQPLEPVDRDQTRELRTARLRGGMRGKADG